MDDRDLERIEQRTDLPGLTPPRAREARGRPFGGAAAASPIVGGKVQQGGVRALDDDPWPGFEDAGEFISHLIVKRCPLGGGDVLGDREYYVKATADPAGAHAGYCDVAEGDVVGWIRTRSDEAVPGAEEGVTFDGYLVAHAGLDGAAMTAVLLT